MLMTVFFPSTGVIDFNYCFGYSIRDKLTLAEGMKLICFTSFKAVGGRVLKWGVLGFNKTYFYIL